MSGIHVSTTVNGDAVEFVCEADETLLDVLRNRLGLTGAKEGCGTGDCGACSVMLDGRLVCSCLVLGAEAGARRSSTIEGMAEWRQLHPLQRKFIEHAALQCGICTPGFLVAAKALLDSNPDPSETEIRYWLAGNLCRCTGYDKIVRAVRTRCGNARRQSHATRHQARQQADHSHVVGTRPLRPDGIDKVTGRARFGADRPRPACSSARSCAARTPMRGSDDRHLARPRSCRASRRSSPRDDFPDLTDGDRGCCDMLEKLHGAREGAVRRPCGGGGRGDQRRRSPAKALKLIKVDYEVLPHVTDVEEAMKPDAPVLHDDIFTEGVEPKPNKPSNIARRSSSAMAISRQGFKEADVIVERTFKTEATHQGYIEPHACLASVGPDGQGEMWCCTQGHFMVRNVCASLLGMDISQAARHRVRNRRRFRRQDHGIHRAVALALSRKAGRPVKIVMSSRGSVPGHRPDRRHHAA